MATSLRVWWKWFVCARVLPPPGWFNPGHARFTHSFAARPSPQTQVRNHWVRAALRRNLLRTHTSTFGHSQSTTITITITITITNTTCQRRCCTCQSKPQV